MKLMRFRVTNFRSVDDSGWIDVDRIAAFIGVNESGKTNLLTPLWKLNPAREGEIHPNSDYPKRLYNDIRKEPGEYAFIEADFEASTVFSAKLAEMSGLSESDSKLI